MKYLPVLLLLAGCASTTELPPPEERTRHYDVAPESAIKAAIAFLEADNYTIDLTGSEYGIVKGDKPFDATFAAFAGPGRFAMTFTVKANGSGSSVMLRTAAFKQNRYGAEVQMSAGAATDETFTKYERFLPL